MKRSVGIVALALAAYALARTAATQRIFVIGDSTVCNYAASKYPWTGWGQHLADFFKTGTVTVTNNALGGRSSRSFVELGQWTGTISALGKGDILMIQFGHNDRDFSKEERYADTATYRKFLVQYLTEARAKGAHPVLVTPMNMNTWTGTAVREVFCENANDYRAAMIRVGKAQKVPVLDLEKKSKALMDSSGATYMGKFQFLGLDAGEYANYPTGSADGTHFQEMGSLANARMVIEEIERQASDSVLKLLAPLIAPRYPVVVKSTVTGDTITRSTMLPMGVTMTAKVRTAKGKTFSHWLKDGVKVGTDKRLTFVQDTLPHSLLAVYQGVVVGAEPRTAPDRAPVARFTAASLVIEGSAPLGTVTLSDINGRLVGVREAAGSSVAFDRHSLPSGTLLARFPAHGSTLRIVNGK